MKPGVLILAALGPLCWPCLSARAGSGADAGRFQPIGIDQKVPAEFPLAPEVLSYLGGKAVVLVTVDAQGRLADALPVYYTDPAFEQAALTAIGKWSFLPARLGGRPIRATKEIDFNFEHHGWVVVSQNISESGDSFFRRHFPSTTTYRAYGLREIDRKLSVIRLVTPPYTEALARRASGTVTLAYYVDEQGRVRMPVTVNDANPELAELAVDAVRQWQFEPPTHDGRRVLVRVCQAIRFNPPADS